MSSCSITATTVEAAFKEIEEACELGADAIELRLDFLQDLKMNDPAPVLKALLAKCKQLDKPAVVTLRPEWEGCGVPLLPPLYVTLLAVCAWWHLCWSAHPESCVRKLDCPRSALPRCTPHTFLVTLVAGASTKDLISCVWQS